MADESYSFTTARTRLEEIVTQVRKKDTSLEKSLDLLEEGVRLANAVHRADRPCGLGRGGCRRRRRGPSRDGRSGADVNRGERAGVGRDAGAADADGVERRARRVRAADDDGCAADELVGGRRPVG